MSDAALTNTVRAINPWDPRSKLSDGTLLHAEVDSLGDAQSAGVRHVAENVAGGIWAGTPGVGQVMTGYHLTQAGLAGKRALSAYRAGEQATVVRKELAQAMDHIGAGMASSAPGGQAYFWVRGAVQGGFFANSFVLGWRHMGQVLSALT